MKEREAQSNTDVPPKPRLRDNLYSRINIPIKVMDMIIWGTVALLVLFILIGVFVLK